MKEYIERNELLKHKRYTSLDRYEIECVIDVDKIIEAPVVDVQEVVHGKWEICCDGYYPYCSVCKEEPSSGNMTKYCPNCGAKMDLK